MLTTLPTIHHRYTLQRQLGAGGMGVVYDAEDRLTGEHVALKLVARETVEMLANSFKNTAATQHDLAVQLAREFQTLASLRHPHIISVLDYGFEVIDGQREIYYTMELLNGGRTILDAGADAALTHKIDLLIALLQALAYLHRRGILHRDVKPENVLVDAIGQLKVLDFGLATLRDQPSDPDGISGTMTYLPPEILRGTSVPSEASDLYAVGVIAYQLLTGSYPYDIKRLIPSILNSAPDLMPLEFLDSEISAPMDHPALDGAYRPTLAMIVGRLLAKQPEERYANAREVIRDLYAAVGRTIPADDPTIRDSFLQAAQFVGRESELEQLTNALDTTLNGAGGAWLIVGESGIGKSRLLDELRIAALVRGATVLRAQATESNGLPFELWRDPLRRLVLAANIDDSAAGTLKELVPDIDALLGRPIPDPPKLDANAKYARLTRVVTGLFASHPSPILFLVEDVHWARESLDLLSAILPLVEDRPLMIVAAARADEIGDLPKRLPGAYIMPLERLTDAAIADLSAAMLGDAGRQPDLHRFIQTQTEGNAFFIVEVMRSLAEIAGSLDEIGVSGLPTAITVGGMDALLRRRLRRVQAMDYPLLEMAAIAGRVLDVRVIAACAPAAHIESWLLRAADTGMLELYDGQWRFAHDKLRETLIADVGARGDEAAIHAQVARGIEAAYPDEKDRRTRAATLAEHWRAAGDARAELRYQQMAGDEALASAVDERAVHHFTRALTLADQLAVDPLARAALLRGRCEAYYNAGNLEQVKLDAAQTFSLLGFELIPRTARARRRLMMLWQEIEQARYRILPRFWIRRAGERQRIALPVIEMLIMTHYFQNNRAEFIYHVLIGLNIADSQGSAFYEEQGRFYATASLMFTLVGLRRLARDYQRRANGRSQSIENITTRLWIALLGSIGGTARADWQTTIPTLEREMALAHRVGHVRREHELATTLGGAYYYTGRWNAVRTLNEAMLEQGRAANNPQAQGWALDNLGRLALRAGNFDEARAILNESFGLYQQVKDIVNTVWVHGALAKTYLCEDDLDSAAIYIEQITPILRASITTSFGMTEPYSAVAEYHLMAWERAKTTGGAIAVHREGAAEAIRMLVRYGEIFLLASVRAALYQGWYAHLEGDTERGSRLLLRAIASAERNGVIYDQGLARVEYARHLSQTNPARAAQLQRAVNIFDQIGAAWDMARAQRLLHNSASIHIGELP
jgi:serine/threonine protein kinase/predicted ATPase